MSSPPPAAACKSVFPLSSQHGCRSLGAPRHNGGTQERCACEWPSTTPRHSSPGPILPQLSFPPLLGACGSWARFLGWVFFPVPCRRWMSRRTRPCPVLPVGPQCPRRFGLRLSPSARCVPCLRLPAFSPPCSLQQREHSWRLTWHEGFGSSGSSPSTSLPTTSFWSSCRAWTDGRTCGPSHGHRSSLMGPWPVGQDPAPLPCSRWSMPCPGTVRPKPGGMLARGKGFFSIAPCPGFEGFAP